MSASLMPPARGQGAAPAHVRCRRVVRGRAAGAGCGGASGARTKNCHQRGFADEHGQAAWKRHDPTPPTGGPRDGADQAGASVTNHVHRYRSDLPPGLNGFCRVCRHGQALPAYEAYGMPPLPGFLEAQRFRPPSGAPRARPGPGVLPSVQTLIDPGKGVGVRWGGL